jgi:hypothetical protein
MTDSQAFQEQHLGLLDPFRVVYWTIIILPAVVAAMNKGSSISHVVNHERNRLVTQSNNLVSIPRRGPDLPEATPGFLRLAMC